MQLLSVDKDLVILMSFRLQNHTDSIAVVHALWDRCSTQHKVGLLTAYDFD